jgi:hypothetical protein
MLLTDLTENSQTNNGSGRAHIPNHYHSAPVQNWPNLPGKLRPPNFRFHRCHHPGVECDNRTNNLPFGLPEVVQHVQETPKHVSHC